MTFDQLRDWIDAQVDAFTYEPGQLYDLALAGYIAGLEAASKVVGGPSFITKKKIKDLITTAHSVEKAQKS